VANTHLDQITRYTLSIRNQPRRRNPLLTLCRGEITNNNRRLNGQCLGWNEMNSGLIS
jgi:hypothetical protein